jgi:hypothetical protein
VLRAEHFTLLAVDRRRLALGLLGAALVGVTPVVTLLTFLSMVSYGARLGLGPALVAVPASVLLLVIVVLISRVASTLLGRLGKARTGAALVGAVFGALQVLAQSGWMVLVGILVSGVLDEGFPTAFSTALRIVPSGWGLVAVEAADRGSWPLALGGLLAMVALIVGLLLVWSRTLGSPRTERVTIRGSHHARPARRRPFATQTGAVVLKELRTWRREPGRTQAIAVPLVWAFGTALLPLTFGSTALLPWAAPGLALMSATSMVNFIGDSGTALWLTLQAGAERAEVRGRQLALLLVFGPLIALVAVCFTAWSGLAWAWPWVLALTPALLGGGVGLVAWLSVVSLVPGPDPHKRSSSQHEHADVTGPAIALFWMGLLPALPAAGVVLAGTLLDSDVLRWSGVPVGFVTGVVLAWWLGRVAYQRLHQRGPELPALMRTARHSQPALEPEVEEPTEIRYSRSRMVVAIIGWTLGPIATFPQGLVPIVIKLADLDVKSWFLALYMPQPWQWPTAIFMVLIGACLLYLAIRASIPDKKAALPDEPGTTEPLADRRETGARPEFVERPDVGTGTRSTRRVSRSRRVRR